MRSLQNIEKSISDNIVTNVDISVDRIHIADKI